MEITDINESVDVAAVFSKTRIKPKWFIWNKKKYDIKETTYTWKEKAGETKFVYFCVSDGATMYEISLNQNTLHWTLIRSSIV